MSSETVRRQIGIGFVGSGFIAEHYAAGLAFVREACIATNASTGGSRGAAFGHSHGLDASYDSIEALCADPAVDLVVVAAAYARVTQQT